MKHEIAMDLLPLYHDGVCSEQSRIEVEEHLKECEICRKALQAMDAPLVEVKIQAEEDKAVVEKISKAWTKGKWKALLSGAVLAVLLCVVVAGGWHLLTKVPMVALGAGELQITEVTQLQDQRVVFKLKARDGKEIDTFDYQYDEERLLITPKRTILPGKYQDMMPWSEMGYSIVDLAEQNQWNSLHGDGTETTQVFLGAGENVVLLWEEGMTLPAASEMLEEYFGYEQGSADYWASRKHSVTE